MQDEVREKSVAFVIRMGKSGAKLTEEVLKCAIRQYLKQAAKPPQGKQSVKSLVRQGRGVRSIEITDRNIRSFERVGRKYGVTYALKKDPTKGRYIVLFRAGDEDALNAAFAEYTAKTLARGRGKPSILRQLSLFKDRASKEAPGRRKDRQEPGL